MQEILVIVRTWFYQAARDPVVAEEASLSRPLSPAQAPPNVANGSSLLDGRRSRIELREGHPHPNTRALSSR